MSKKYSIRGKVKYVKGTITGEYDFGIGFGSNIPQSE
jgi:hypothetical protein